jgi:hypothetical protein
MGRIQLPNATCVKVLGLNREGLPEERLDVYHNILAAVHIVAEPQADGANSKVIRAKFQIDRCKRGIAQYALAGRYALGEARNHLETVLELIG